MPRLTATRSRILAVTLATALAVPMLSSAAQAAPAAPPVVAIEHADVISTTSRTLDVSVSVALQRPAGAMDIRLRVIDARGSVLLQETQSRRRLEAATYVLGFTRELRPRDLPDGRHRVEVQVSVTGQSPVVVTEPLYVADPARPPLMLAVIVRAEATPTIAAAGEMAAETTEGARLRVEAETLLRAAAADPARHLTFALPPFLVDEWRRRGTTVPAGTALLRVPYADPDVAGLESMGAIGDLGYQLGRSSLSASDTVASRTSTGAVIAGYGLSPASARLLTAAGIRYALLSPEAASAGPAGRETTAPPGVHAVAGVGLSALVFDTRASSLLAGAGGDVTGLLDHLFARRTAASAKGRSAAAPVVAVIRIGNGSPVTAADLTSTLADLGRIPWLRLVDASQAAATAPTDTVSLPVRARTGPAAPDGYWGTVRTARSRALALRAATGPADPDSIACVNEIMAAECRAWAGPDGLWAGSAPGLAFAASADRRASAFLSAVSLAVPAVTLSGNAGKVPVSITNGSGKELRLRLRMRSSAVRLPGGPETDVVLRPGENILSVPVDLRESLRGSLRLDLVAGASTIATATCEVRASYIDRLVLLGTVVLVLLVFLWYIRRRSGAAARAREAPDDAGES